MSFSSNSEKSVPSHISWQALAGFSVLTVAFFYLWVLPLFRPRGDFLWGYYSLKDIYLGIPVGLGLLSATSVFAVPGRYKRLLALRLASVSISIMVALFACDAVYALILNGAWRPNFWLDQAHIARRYSIADDELGFVRKPGVSWRGFVPEVNRLVDYDTDENGFRNPEGLRRADVVFVGDSFTEGATVDLNDTFVRRAGAASGLSVVNLGRGAYGPQQELIVIRRYGLAYHPRVVVWQLFEGNDLDDSVYFANWKKNPQPGNVSFKERYLENSLIAQWIPKARPAPIGPLVRMRHKDGSETRTTLRYIYDSEAALKNHHGFAETSQAIEEGYRLCQSQGVRLLVVSVPPMVRVMEPFITFESAEDRSSYLPNGGGEQSSFNQKIADLCGNLGCTFIDAFKPLRQAAAFDNTNLYIPVDEHLDIRGHEVVAQSVSEWIRSQVSPGEEVR